jgi:hypothetical protein
MRGMRYLAFATLAICLFVAAASTAAAQGPGTISECPPGKVCLPNPLGTTATAETLIERIVDWLIVIAAPIAAVMIIYGAFQMLFAGGETEKFTNGRRTILYAVVGYGIIFIGRGIISIIKLLLTTSP